MRFTYCPHCGTKLIKKEQGNIVIAGSDKVDIENTRLETINTSLTEKNGATANTYKQNGGEIHVSANGDVTIKDSLITMYILMRHI